MRTRKNSQLVRLNIAPPPSLHSIAILAKSLDGGGGAGERGGSLRQTL